MRSREWYRLRTVVEQVLERPAREREALLDSACGSDLALRGEAESILAAHDAAGGFLEAVWPEGCVDDLRPGDRVGDVRLERCMSQGGTATVWRVRSLGSPAAAAGSTLAVKIARPDLPAADLRRRFAEEERILSGLCREGVVGLRGAGRYRGRPYLVLDWVEGEPLDDYCDAGCLGVEERLRLMRAVAEIVGDLHRARVVHRDLKPGNVLVRPDGRPILVDFGLARRLDERDGTVIGRPTEPLARLITPGYAPPEQIWGGPVTPAVDVFGLGAVIYRLLLGETPPGPWEYGSRGLEELTGNAVVGSRSSARPSRAAVAVSAEVCARLGLSPRALARRLRGDLDRILTRALDPLPGRRHPTAAALAADLDRHLAGLPSAARRGALASLAAGALAALLMVLDLVAGDRPR